MVVVNTLVPPILFVDLENPGVLVVRRRKYLRRLTFQEDGGVRLTAVDKAADHDHAANKAGFAVRATSAGREFPLAPGARLDITATSP